MSFEKSSYQHPCIVIIQANFYQEIAANLQKGAIEVLHKNQMRYQIIEVPGCFEIPAALAMTIATKKYDGFLTLGCLIRGETTHYDHICAETVRGINQLALKHRVPIGFGVITAENRTQAEYRACMTGKNNGGKAATACLAMYKIKQNLLK